MEEYVYGLDFGTSTTLMAIPRDGIPQILPIGRSDSWMPSLIAIDAQGNVKVGDAASDQAHADQIRSPKTAITRNEFGCLASPSGKTIEADLAIVKILEEVHKKAKELGLNTQGRVRLSCPAMWTGIQRNRLAALAQLAGIHTDVDSMLDEPVAACVSWWWNNFYSRNKRQTAKVLVFDLGGGTLDVAVADIYGEHTPDITVLAARGIAIAGDSLDFALADHFESRILSEYQIDLAQNIDYPIIRNLAIRAARKVKEGLSFLESIKFTLEDPDYSFIPTLEISRLDLEMVYRPDLISAMHCVKATLKETYLKNHNHDSAEMKNFQSISHEVLAEDIKYVVLAGGMSRMPIIRDELQKLFPKSIIESALDNNYVTESIVMGVSNRNEYESLNIHRPNFNFKVKWIEEDGAPGELNLYSAFEPLHSDAEIFQSQFLLGYPNTWIPDKHCIKQEARLILESVGGRRVKLSIEGIEIDYIALKVFKNQPVQFKIYLDGRIMITDQERTYSFRVKQWPYIRWHTDQSLRERLSIQFVANENTINALDKSWLADDF